VIHAIEYFDNKTILHVEVDIPNDMFDAIDFDIDFRITVKKRFGLDILEENLTGSGKPGEIVPYQIYVNNTGNVEDRALIGIETSGPGWSVSINRSFVDVSPGDPGPVSVDVVPPVNALAEDNITMVISAKSRGNMSIVDTVNITTFVDPVFYVNISGPNLTKRVLPGDTASFEVEIVNEGNALDDIELNLQYQKIIWEPSIVFNGTNVTPGGTRVAIVNVTPPIGTLEGENETLILEAESKGDPEKEDQIVLKVIVDPVYGVDILGPNITRSEKPGISVHIPVTIQNTGNTLEPIWLNVSTPSPDWEANLDITEFQLGQGENRTVTVSISPPENAPAGSNETALLNTRTIGDIDASDTMSITVQILPVAEVSTIPTENVSALPGEQVESTFAIWNTGNSEDSYIVGAECDQDWVVYTKNYNESAVLQPGQRLNVTVVTEVPGDALAGVECEITFTVTSVLDQAVTSNATATVVVLPVYSFTLETALNQTSIKEEETAEFSFDVTNTGNSGAVFSLQVTGDRVEWAVLDVESFNLGIDGKRSVTLKISPVDANEGDYVYKVTVTTENVTKSLDFKVTVEAKPTPTQVESGLYLYLLLVIIITVVLIVVILYMRSRKADKVLGEEREDGKTENEEGEDKEET
jgi:uncharacterized membrane protein